MSDRGNDLIKYLEELHTEKAITSHVYNRGLEIVKAKFNLMPENDNYLTADKIAEKLNDIFIKKFTRRKVNELLNNLGVQIKNDYYTQYKNSYYKPAEKYKDNCCTKSKLSTTGNDYETVFYQLAWDEKIINQLIDYLIYKERYDLRKDDTVTTTTEINNVKAIDILNDYLERMKALKRTVTFNELKNVLDYNNLVISNQEIAGLLKTKGWFKRQVGNRTFYKQWTNTTVA